MDNLLAKSCDKPIPFYKSLQDLENGINLETGEVICSCTRSRGMFIFNETTKKIIPLKCKAYACEHCGPIKTIKFRVALEKYLKSFDFVRMFTFTQHTPENLEPAHQHENISKVWSLFMKEVRRDKTLSERQRKFQYVKVTEFTERKFVHYHVVISVFLPILTLRKHWNNALFKVFGFVGGRGGINIKTMANAKNCAAYITKYISKMLQEDFGKLRRWSKSNKISIFEKFDPVDKWHFFYISPTGSLNLKKKSTTTQYKNENFNVFSSKLLIRDKLLNEIVKIFFDFD